MKSFKCCIYYGPDQYDARREPVSWDKPGAIDASAWHTITILRGPGGKLEHEITSPIRKERAYSAVSRKVLNSGAIVFDLGQNFAGWPEIAVRGEAGAQVKLTCGELLADDGTVSQRSANQLPGRAQWYTYTLSGGAIERWHPRFSYTGFRYVQAEITGRADLIELHGDSVYSSAAVTGEFKSGIPLINQIHSLILKAIENNMESVLTDCPHREKLGWLEQTHLMGSALNFDFDLERLYSKIDGDIADAQQGDGKVPTIAPQYTIFQPDAFNDTPEWGSAAVLNPWIIYRRYGDLQALKDAYPVMRRYLSYLTSRSQNGIIDYGLGDWYDIGPKAPGFAQLTSVALTATGVYYQDIVALRSAAMALGYKEEEAQLEALRVGVASAFQKRFFHPEEHSYDTGSQTANAMPLAIGVVPEGEREAVLRRLIADIRAHSNHVTAGDVGFHYVVDALMESDASDVLLDMLLRTDTPSYGFQLSRGATALTEAWDASPNSSQDHLMLGHAEEWFYAGLGGLDINFSKTSVDPIVVHPAMLRQIPSAQVSYRSVRGTIDVSWSHEDHGTMLVVSIPANTTARIILPGAAAHGLLESGVRVSKAAGVLSAKEINGQFVIRVESGQYRFSFPTRAMNVH